MLRPACTLALGSWTMSSDGLGTLAALDVTLAANGGADEVVATFGRAPDVDVEPGTPATVGLGWDGDAQPVFSGEVAAVDRGLAWVEVVCHGVQARLLRLRTDRALVGQTAGQVVAALAADAGVPPGTVEDGLELPVCLVDSGRSGWDHCLDLARRCGFDLYVTPEGTLVFAAPSAGGTAHAFRYGEHVLDLRLERGVAEAGATVVPESPASRAGDETAAWLAKDPSAGTGTAGEGGPPRGDPMLRTRQAADTAAAARLDASRTAAVAGRLDLVGSPAVRVGDRATVEGVPGGALDGTFRVLGVRHRIDRRRGFRTRLVLGGIP